MSEPQNSKVSKTGKPAASAPASATPVPPSPASSKTADNVIPPLFRKLDWMTAGIAFLILWTIYFITLAPELTLKDSGELVTASVYAGIPHPPGYPVWTIYTWLWTVLLPFGNMCWRVTVGEATAAALGCGLLALMVSRGSSMLMESIEDLKKMTGKWEAAICLVSGVATALVMGLDGYMWSESVVINRISLFGMPWLMLVLVLLLRWLYAPSQMRYLYISLFCFGICATIHQTLINAAMGIEVAVIVAHPKLGRDMLFGNFLVYMLAIIGSATQTITALDMAGPMIRLIFHMVGMGSLIGCIWLTFKTGGFGGQFGKVVILGLLWLLGSSFYFYMPISGMTNPPMQWGYPRTVEGFFHALTRGQYEKVTPTDIFHDPGRFINQLGQLGGGVMDEFSPAFAFLAILPFIFLLKMRLRERAWILTLAGIYCCIGVLLMVQLNPNPDRASVDLVKVFFVSSHTLIALLMGYGLALTAAFMATNYDRFRIWGMAGGVVAVLLAFYCLLNSTAKLYFGLDANLPLSELGQWVGHAFEKDHFGLPVFANLLLIAMSIVFVLAVAIYRQRAPLFIMLGLFAMMPLYPGLSHWHTSEQRGHMFGYWFGHDMFTPPFNGPDKKPIYPEMAKDAVLFGGTDPGRFCPTYMIFCESFTPHNCQPVEDQKFDRRDVYIITQNALADGTYLNYIRAHYNRSKQIDPPFFQEFVRSTEEKRENYKTNIIARIVSPLDTYFTALGARIEKQRRTYTSWFTEKDFTNLSSLVSKLRAGHDPLSKWIFDNLSKETQGLLAATGSDAAQRKALAADLNKLIDRELTLKKQLAPLYLEKNDVDTKITIGKGSDSLLKKQTELAKQISTLSTEEPLYTPARFAQVKLSDYVKKFAAQNPRSDTRVRLNRLLLEEAYPGEIAKSMGAIYPDREIYIPSPEDSQQCFNDYIQDAQRRATMNPPQLKPGEDVKVVDDKVQVSGQVAVMSINGLLTKVIFDHNPDNEFYVEESFPLDWMFPHLTPYGVIMKINRKALPSLSEEDLQKDHLFWKEYSKRFTGDIVDYDTKVSDVTAWVEKTYMRKDFTGFKGDRKFVRDEDAQKAFSKLRSSIGGIYAYRLGIQGNTFCAPEYRPKTKEETERLTKEANFAFLQAFLFCPYSPEAVFRYVNFLIQNQRIDDAILVAETCLKFDPNNGSVVGLVQNLRAIRQQNPNVLKNLEDTVTQSPTNFMAALQLADGYFQLKKYDQAEHTLDSIVTNPKVDANVLAVVAQNYIRLTNYPKLEVALDRMVTLTPENPETWYDLAILRVCLGKTNQALPALEKALKLSAKRLKKDSKANNLKNTALLESRLAPLHEMAEYKKIMAE